MGKNKVEVFLGEEQVLISKVSAKKVDVTPDEKVSPFILINRSNHPVDYIYNEEKRPISPKGEALLGDVSKLDQKSLSKHLMIKKIQK